MCCRVRFQLASGHEDLGSVKSMLSGGVSVSPVLYNYCNSGVTPKSEKMVLFQWEPARVVNWGWGLPFASLMKSLVRASSPFDELSHLPIENLTWQVKVHQFIYIYNYIYNYIYM